jgi:hypothetical protein
LAKARSTGYVPTCVTGSVWKALRVETARFQPQRPTQVGFGWGLSGFGYHEWQPGIQIPGGTGRI